MSKRVLRRLALAAVLMVPLSTSAKADCVDYCIGLFWVNYDWCMATVGASGYCIAVGWEAERKCLGECNLQ